MEAPDVHVTNATVVALNQFDSRISNAGAARQMLPAAQSYSL